MTTLTARNGGRAALVILALLTVTGLALRVGYAVEAPAEQPPDSFAYARIAENLYHHGSFDARAPGAPHEIQPASSYSPGLPLLAAAVYWLSGGVHLTLFLILLALLGAGAIPMTYLLGRRLAGTLAGLTGAAVIAIYPALLEYQGLLLTEPLAAFLLSAGLVVFWARQSGVRRSAAGWPVARCSERWPWSGPSTSPSPSWCRSLGYCERRSRGRVAKRFWPWRLHCWPPP